MIIQVASDLHHEIALSGSRLAQPLQPAPGADVLVLAGDIHSGTAGIELYSDYPIPVIYIHGNHEPYQCAYPTLVDEMRERSEGTAVRFLQNDEFTLGDIRFLGACMWSDYGLFPLRFDDSLELARHAVTDHRLIRRSSDGAYFQPEDALAHQRETLLWLPESLDVPFRGRTVVVTHHLPSPMSVRPEFRNHKLGKV